MKGTFGARIGKVLRRSRLLVAGAVFALAAFAASAEAGIVTFDTKSGGTTQIEGGNVGGDGNSRTFTAGGLTMTATGWSIATVDAATRNAGYLGLYSAGLGVTNVPEDGSGNTHTVDNQSGFDFVQMLFSQQVRVLSVTVTAFSLGGSTDRDITVSFGDWYSAPRSAYDTSSTTNPFTHNITQGFGSSQLNVFASLTSTGNIDAFKITQVVVETTSVPLPPAAWAGLALMGGLGVVGAVRRRRALRAF